MRVIFWSASALLVLSFAFWGCGGYNNNSSTTTNSSTSCFPTGLSVFPQNVTLSHATPNDSQQFGATVIQATTCTTATPTPTPIPPFTVTWSSSDPTDVPISNNHDATNGTATCVNVTHLPVTLVATLPATAATNNVPLTGNATINCN